MIGSASDVARGPRPAPTCGTFLTNHQDLGLNLQIYVSIDEPAAGGIGEEWLEGVAKSALVVALDSPDAAQISLLITGDQTVRSLNARYRGLDEVTDVLSFSAEHQGHWEGPDNGSAAYPDGADEIQFVLPPDEPNPLGEVIVAYPQVQRQAEEHHIPLEHELAHLIIHGVLHLTGHDHADPEESALMRAKELAALESLKTPEGFFEGLLP